MTAKFVWYDAMTTDVAAAQEFYTKVVGWSAMDSGMPDRTYILLSAGPAMVGGLMPIPPDAKGMPPAWMGYIGVDDVDAMAVKVKAAGGAIRRDPAEIPGVGRFAVAADPHGAGFILFKGNGETPAAVAPGAPGHIGWHELHAGELGAAWSFYSGLFGWTKLEALDMGAMGTYPMFSPGEGQGGGMMTRMAHVPHPFWLYYFNVDAIDAAAARATLGGGKVVNGPMQVPGGQWIVQCIDPQGGMFAMVAMGR